ncbi:MAG: hypothetical protein LBG97_08310 [Coriobacteriales bacterium]|jgi:hypothetical protein|nr:hypothetical protein [Coriobacteriales bacterium]
MTKKKKNIINGYSGLAVGSAIVSLPLAFLDIFFLRLAIAYLMNAPENDPLIWVASASLSVIALVLAAFAGRFFVDPEHTSRAICYIIGAIWLVIGIFFFVIRLFAEFSKEDQEPYVSIIMSLGFLVIYVADGFLGFLAARELLNPLLHAYLKEKKKAEQQRICCYKKITDIGEALSAMNQITAAKQVLINSMRDINLSYFSEAVPSRMIALERELRDKGLLFGNADNLWLGIGYDPVTRHPNEEADRLLLENFQLNEEQ